MGGWGANPPRSIYSAGVGEYSKAYHDFMMTQQMAAIAAQRNAMNAYKPSPMANNNVIDLDADQWSEVEKPKQIEKK